MGFAEDAKETAQAGVTKVTRATEDTVDRIKDHTAEAKADAKVKEAEAEQASTERRATAKETLRGN